MKTIQNYKPSYKEMFSLDIIDPLYFVPMVLSIVTGLSLSNWVFVNYNPSWHLAIEITPMVLALLYHYWIERLTVNYTMVVLPDEDCIYYTKTTLFKVVIHWVYNLLGHSFFLFLILYFLEPYHPVLNVVLFLVWLTIPCLVRTYLKGISLEIIKVTFEKNETFWGKTQRDEFLEKYNRDSDKLQEKYSG